jgi:signal transduction histidine kinase
VNAVVEIAHDMRSPLTSILFLVDTLRRGQSGPVTPVQERQLGLIYGAALGLNTLSCDVIDALRGGQRLVDGHPVPFSLSEVILGVCDTVRPISEEKGVPIRHVLPTLDGRIGYPGILARVLLNLVTNALKFTQDGTVEVGAADLTDTSVRFWVADTGEGIPPHVMAMLFDGFRPSASGMRFSNAGLGLAICQNFLGAMGAALEVESAEHRGTRFSFEINLPRA